MKAHPEEVIRRRIAEKMPCAGLDQYPGMGGAPGELLGVDLRRRGQPEGVGMFATGNDPALREMVLQSVIEAIPALGRVVMVAPQMRFIVALGKEMGHLILNIGWRVAVRQSPQRPSLIDQVRIGNHKAQPQTRR